MLLLARPTAHKGDEAPAEARGRARHAVYGRVRRDLERRPATGAEHAPHLRDVGERDGGIGNVLEDHVGHAAVDGGVADAGEAAAVPVQPPDVGESGIERGGARACSRARSSQKRSASVALTP